MTAYKKSFECTNENDTKTLACKIAQISKKGDVFALYGTLGAGKSTFSRYFIQYFMGNIDIPSPTFTLVQTYSTADFNIYHYDMYRLKHYEEAFELGIDEAFYNDVNLIEWPEKIEPVLPKNIWKISIILKNGIRLFEIETFSEEKQSRLKEIVIE